MQLGIVLVGGQFMKASKLLRNFGLRAFTLIPQ
jgi:hypothetical protein